jgi:hypothetical protein
MDEGRCPVHGISMGADFPPSERIRYLGYAPWAVVRCPRKDCDQQAIAIWVKEEKPRICWDRDEAYMRELGKTGHDCGSHYIDTFFEPDEWEIIASALTKPWPRLAVLFDLEIRGWPGSGQAADRWGWPMVDVACVFTESRWGETTPPVDGVFHVRGRGAVELLGEEL